MRDRKKIAWIALAGLLIISLIGGTAWIGDQPVSAEISEQAKGQFVGLDDANRKITVAYEGMERTYPLAADVWVYRNLKKATMAELKQGDTLDIIFNSKNQAAYIKAVDQSSTAEAAPALPAADRPDAPAQVQAASPVEAAPPAEAKPAGSEVASRTLPPAEVNAGAGASAVPAEKPSAAVANGASGQPPKAWAWKEFELELKSKELELKLEHEPKGNKADAKVYIQMKDRSEIRMKGAEAEQMLLLLMQGLPEDKTAWEQALKQRLASELNLQNVAFDKWELDIKWNDGANAAATIPPAEHSQPEPKGKGKDKEHDKGKGHDKDRGKHDDDDDD